MKVVISLWNGNLYDVERDVVRVTKTMVVVRWGPTSERRFNRRTGRVVGGRTGLGSMTNPRITQESLDALNAAVEKAEAEAVVVVGVEVGMSEEGKQ